MRNLLLIATLLLSACSAQDVSDPREGDEARILRCYAHGSAPGDFCRASMLQIVTSRGLFEGRQVIVPGYLGDIHGDRYLFPTKEFYTSRDLASSVRVLGDEEVLADKIGTNIIVFGTFTLGAPDSSTLLKPVGAIAVTTVRNGYNGP